MEEIGNILYATFISLGVGILSYSETKEDLEILKEYKKKAENKEILQKILNLEEVSGFIGVYNPEQGNVERRNLEDISEYYNQKFSYLIKSKKVRDYFDISHEAQEKTKVIDILDKKSLTVGALCGITTGIFENFAEGIYYGGLAAISYKIGSEIGKHMAIRQYCTKNSEEPN